MNYDLILTLIPIGFIASLYPMICGKSKYTMSNTTIAMYASLLSLQAGIFYAMNLIISSILTFVNVGAWILIWWNQKEKESKNGLMEKIKQPGSGKKCSICGLQLNKWEEESETNLCFACYVECNT